MVIKFMLNGKILVRWYFLRYSIDLSMCTFIYKMHIYSVYNSVLHIFSLYYTVLFINHNYTYSYSVYYTVHINRSVLLCITHFLYAVLFITHNYTHSNTLMTVPTICPANHYVCTQVKL